MYARIENDQIVELCQVGGEGWLDVPSYLEDSPKVYDPETGEIREKTEAEIAGELDALVLEGAWSQLRGLRDSFLRETDAYLVSDRPETENMAEYREYLRDLPSTYTDSTILEQEAVMDFDAYVASL